MSAIKVVLRQKPNKDGSLPLAIRITKDRKTSFIHLGYDLQEKHWDKNLQKVKKGHPNSERLNNLIITRLAEYSDKVIELQTDKKDTSSHIIKKSIKGVSDVTFNAQAKIYLDNLKTSGKYNRLSAEEPRVNRFKEFLKNRDIHLKEITVSLLNQYRAYLKGTRTITERTVINHLIVIRSIYNQAKKAHLIDPKYYPFGSDKIHIKFPESIKIGLITDEITALEKLDLPIDRQHHARNLWLFAFYFAGMRVSDVFRLTWSQIHDGRLYYAMGKNNKVGSLKIPEKAQKILDQYKAGKDATDLVFPELKDIENMDDAYYIQMRIKRKLQDINAALRLIKDTLGLDKPLTMHIPRHSFGNISGDKIPVQMLQKLYRHTHISTTIGYQANFIHKDADDALDAVISF